MAKFRTSSLTAILVLLLSSGAAEAAEVPPIVVELFTSQGCSSCPPADAYLGELSHRPGVVTLGFHVDYWNYIGWSDPFAAPFSSERQRAYQKRLRQRYVYTPQMVIDGRLEGVGAEPSVIEPLIADAAAKRPPHPDLTVERQSDGSLGVHVGALATPAEAATVWLIGYDRPQSTEVPSGENSGRTITDYCPVRMVRQLAAWSGPAVDATVSAADLAHTGNGGVAVLVQQGGDGPILTAQRIDFPTP